MRSESHWPLCVSNSTPLGDTKLGHHESHLGVTLRRNEGEKDVDSAGCVGAGKNIHNRYACHTLEVPSQTQTLTHPLGAVGVGCLQKCKLGHSFPIKQSSALDRSTFDMLRNSEKSNYTSFTMPFPNKHQKLLVLKIWLRHFYLYEGERNFFWDWLVDPSIQLLLSAPPHRCVSRNLGELSYVLTVKCFVRSTKILSSYFEEIFNCVLQTNNEM